MGFTISHPDHWGVFEANETQAHLQTVWLGNPGTLDPTVRIDTMPMATPMTAAEYGARYASDRRREIESYLLEFEEGEVTIGGEPAYEYHYSTRAGIEKGVFIVGQDRLFHIWSGDHPNVFLRNASVVDKVMYSFRLQQE